MQIFTIRYRNTQGTQMRNLNAVSRRGLDIPAVSAAPAGAEHRVTLSLDVNQKQVGQLQREWYSIVDVIHVGSGAEIAEWPAPHPPAGIALGETRAAAGA